MVQQLGRERWDLTSGLVLEKPREVTGSVEEAHHREVVPTYPARRIAELLPENWAATVGAPALAAPPARLPEFTIA